MERDYIRQVVRMTEALVVGLEGEGTGKVEIPKAGSRYEMTTVYVHSPVS